MPDTNAQGFDLTSRPSSVLYVYKICSPPCPATPPKVESTMRQRRQAHGGNNISDEREWERKRKNNERGGGEGKMSKRPGKGNYSDPHQSFANLDKSGYILGKGCQCYTPVCMSPLCLCSLLFLFGCVCVTALILTPGGPNLPPPVPRFSHPSPPHACRQRA